VHRTPHTSTIARHPNQVLARAIARGTAEPVNDYLKMTNKKKVLIRDIDPKAVSTQELYGFVNMATREWKVSGQAGAARACQGLPSCHCG
jgi:sulfite reductase beta subunit-like hemoprotein